MYKSGHKGESRVCVQVRALKGGGWSWNTGQGARRGEGMSTGERGAAAAVQEEASCSASKVCRCMATLLRPGARVYMCMRVRVCARVCVCVCVGCNIP